MIKSNVKKNKYKINSGQFLRAAAMSTNSHSNSTLFLNSILPKITGRHKMILYSFIHCSDTIPCDSYILISTIQDGKTDIIHTIYRNTDDRWIFEEIYFKINNIANFQVYFTL
jgi:hypothetical protein